MNVKKIISICLFVIGITAVLGGYNLMMNNGGGLPLEWLHNTPFETYFLPGVILTFVVGGTYVLAALAFWMNNKYAAELVAVAGFGLLIWIFTEIYMIGHTHWLQILYFGLGILTILISMAELKFSKRELFNDS